MAVWFVFALMTAAAVFAVLWPLSRRGGPAREGSDANVYRDQLDEVSRDAAVGLIEKPEAEAARIEISRRLLASADAETGGGAPSVSRAGLRRAVAVLALIGLPLMAVAIYVPLGSPSLGDFPLAQRTAAPSATQPMDALVAKVEAHLAKNPTDGRGWAVLAPVLAKLGRFEEAARAYRNALSHDADTAERRADLGETLAAAAGGVVTAEAKAEFERAVALDPNEVKGRYFLGLAAEQDGRITDAAAIWRDMLAKAPTDAPWKPLLQTSLARVGAGAMPPAPADAVAAAKDMTEAESNTMIRGMVERLATRLKQNGDDVEGWLRLVRAYMVLGERDQAKAALADARQAVSGNAERLRQLNEGLKDFGLDG